MVPRMIGRPRMKRMPAPKRCQIVPPAATATARATGTRSSSTVPSPRLAKHTPYVSAPPPAAYSRPPRKGPPMLATRSSMLLAASAWASCSRGTICGKRLCSAGAEKARAQPNSTSTA